MGDLLTRVRRCRASDAGELLTLQRAAFVDEAREYRDVNLPPLRDSLQDVCAQLAAPGTVVLVSTLPSDGEHGRRGRIVGSARLHVGDGVGRVGRVVVAPDVRGFGVGSALLLALHREAASHPGLATLELFTGARSQRNLALYRRHGYRDAGHRVDDVGVDLLVLQRPV